jgi:hypothetical protein
MRVLYYLAKAAFCSGVHAELLEALAPPVLHHHWVVDGFDHTAAAHSTGLW